MTTSAARIAPAVHWLGFGSAPTTAVTSEMEFTTFRSTGLQRGEYRSASFRDSAAYSLCWWRVGRGNDAAARLEFAGFLSHGE